MGDASEHAQMQLVALCDPVERIMFMLALPLSVGFYHIPQCLHTVILGQWVTISHIIRSEVAKHCVLAEGQCLDSDQVNRILSSPSLQHDR